jgi:hypothetical protein
LHAIAPHFEAPAAEPEAQRQPHRRQLFAALIAFGVVLAVYGALRPPLYNFDGYSAQLQALQPLDAGNINPHHLAWYPFERVVGAGLAAAGVSSPEAFQWVGILVMAASLAILCGLLARRSGRILLPSALTLFIAFSPSIWALGLQNQPYTVLELCIAVFLCTLGEWRRPSRARLIASGVALGAAVLLQQAMAITVPAIGLGWIIASEGRLAGRIKRALTWTCAIGAGVASVYLVAAHSAEIAPSGFAKWVLEYLQDQHGIQLHWPLSAIKSVMGMVGTLIESSWISYRVNPWQHSAAISRIYEAILAGGLIGVAIFLARRDALRRLWARIRTQTPFTMVLLQIGAWSVFVILWEPTGHFWSVNLFPLAFLATGWMKSTRRRTAFLAAGILLMISSWNIYANHQKDKAYSVSYPPPLLAQIRSELGPNDAFIVGGRDWYANRDYGLLLECLDDWPRDPAIALVDDYVLKNPGGAWEPELRREIGHTFASGGRIYVADHVLWDDSYRDLEQTGDPLSTYAHMEYAGLGGSQIAGEIRNFFSGYASRPSSFRIGSETFFEITPPRALANH